ncbi:hypothetical protein [Methanobrevibacter wolinii]|uniref:hypothetical protein n=1 Tax=Methanobrevibacter wolinii TaxID=190977 RepID=UPI0005B2CF9A|nr:hypothetical protein [Methanobrevibacter wolinii]MDD5960098.1 hypothetical protein [Methanobrevibacter wolinii]
MDYGKVYKDSIINLININEKLINSVDKKAVFVICDDDTRKSIDENFSYINSFLLTEYVIQTEYDNFKELYSYVSGVFKNEYIYKYLLQVFGELLEEYLRVAEFKFELMKKTNNNSFTNFDSDALNKFFTEYQLLIDEYDLFKLEYSNVEHYSLLGDYANQINNGFKKNIN